MSTQGVELGHEAGPEHADHVHGAPRRGRSAGSDPGRRAAERRSLSLTLGLTVTIMVVEAVGGAITGSLALQADAGHMLTDSSSLLLAVAALWFASRPADPKRTYGYYRLEILAALANGVALLLIAAFIAWEAVRRIREPRAIDAGTTLVIAAIGLGANVVGLWLLHGRKASLNARGAYLHIVGDTLSSVGVVLATVLVLLTGWTVADPVVSIAIAAVVVYGAYRLVREAVDVLLEAVPAHLDLAEVLHDMEGVAGVSAVHDLHIWTISSGMHALSAHVVVDSCDLGRNDDILRHVRELLLSRFDIDHATLQIETPAHCAGAPVPH